MKGGSGISNGLQHVHESTPLLGMKEGASKKASTLKTYGNIFVAIVGSGVLGLPYTFKTSGYAVAAISVVCSSVLSWHCMMKLVKCRNELESRGNHIVVSYGDLGELAFGNWARQFVDFMILISQSGCCVAYLIFIGQNVASIVTGDISRYSYFIAILFPLQMLLSWIRSLAGLAPFSFFADACNILAMAVVVKDDVHDFTDFSKVTAFQGWSAVPFAVGVAIYCYEGFGMTLTLQSSMQRPKEFGRALAVAFGFITALYVFFGFIGYLAYGDETKDIITLNLPNDWTTIAVKGGLSIGLFFTFPVMLYPVHEIFERKMLMSHWFQDYCSHPVLELSMRNGLRGLIVLAIAIVAATVPGFGLFISFVGSTVCAMIAFVIPAFLHIQICGETSSFVSKLVDSTLIISGVVFAGYGTFITGLDIFRANQPGPLPGA
ncbi:unnamed protein product [Calypogeia fissa]